MSCGWCFKVTLIQRSRATLTLKKVIKNIYIDLKNSSKLHSKEHDTLCIILALKWMDKRSLANVDA